MIPPHVRKRSWSRVQRLRELGHADYSAYLRSPEWRAVKARYHASDLPQACMCGEEDVQLHHKTYDRVGEELLTDLVPLCANCHAMIHALERRGELGLDFAGFESAERATRYAAEQQPAQDKRQDELAHFDVRADKAETKRMTTWIRAYPARARRAGIDPQPLFDELEAILDGIAAKLTVA